LKNKTEKASICCQRVDPRSKDRAAGLQPWRSVSPAGPHARGSARVSPPLPPRRPAPAAGTRVGFASRGCLNHSMVGVGRDLCGSPSPTPCPSRVTHSSLQRTLSKWVLNISREGDSTASLASITGCVCWDRRVGMPQQSHFGQTESFSFWSHPNGTKDNRSVSEFSGSKRGICVIITNKNSFFPVICGV